MSGDRSAADNRARKVEVSGDHHCFGCGHLNPHGLKLTFFEDSEAETLWTEWTPSREQEGFNGIAHGGMITTVLDEVMGWVLSSRRIWAVTGKLDVRFRKPVEIGTATRTTGWIDQDKGRMIQVRAEMRSADSDQLLADASGTFVRVPEQRAAEWEERYLD